MLTVINSPDGFRFLVEVLGCGWIVLLGGTFNFAHEVPLVDSVGVVVAEDAAMIGPCEVRDKECEVVADNVALFIDPCLLTENSDASGTNKRCLVVDDLVQANPSAHERTLAQVVGPAQHLEGDPACAGPIKPALDKDSASLSR